MEDFPVEIISGVKLAATAAAYGIGIGAAVAREKARIRERDTPLFPREQFQVDNSGYNPDARKVGGVYQKTSQWDGYMSSALFGMPVLCYLKFIGKTYTTLQGQTITLEDIIIEQVLISVTMGKNIKTTEILGRDSGSIKEYIGQRDWEVEIRAIISADSPVNSSVTKKAPSGVYPRENIGKLYKTLMAPVPLEVSCWYLNQLGIQYLVVSDGVRMEQTEGEYSSQRVIIPCVSDNFLELKFVQ